MGARAAQQLPQGREQGMLASQSRSQVRDGEAEMLTSPPLPSDLPLVPPLTKSNTKSEGKNPDKATQRGQTLRSKDKG